MQLGRLGGDYADSLAVMRADFEGAARQLETVSAELARATAEGQTLRGKAAEAAAAVRGLQASRRKAVLYFLQRRALPGCSGVFAAWRQAAAASRMPRRAAARLTARWRHRRAAFVLDSLRGAVAVRQRQRARVLRMLQRSAARTLCACLSRWDEHAAGARRHRALLRRAVARMEGAAVAGAFATWRGLSARYRSARQLLSRVQKRSTWAAFQRWARRSQVSKASEEYASSLAARRSASGNPNACSVSIPSTVPALDRAGIRLRAPASFGRAPSWSSYACPAVLGQRLRCLPEGFLCSPLPRVCVHCARGAGF